MTLTITRPIPHDLHAEQCVLGAILLEPSILPEVTAVLQPDDLYLERHRWIYEAVMAAATNGEEPNLVAVASHLRRHSVRDGNGGHMTRLEAVGGMTYLATLSTSVPTAYYGADYARHVYTTALRRRLIETGGHITAMAYDESVELTETMAAAEERLHSITRSRGGTRPLGKSVHELLRMQFPERSWIMEGILPEGLTLCAGAPKTGKSWLWLSIAVAAANGIPWLGVEVRQSNVLYLSLEDGERRLQERLRAMRVDRVSHRFEYDCEARRIDDGVLAQIEAWLSQRDNLPTLIIIDTLAMIKPLRQSMQSIYDADYRGVMGLRVLAQRYHSAVVLVHHTRKQDATEIFDTISGSQGLMGAVESEMVMRRRNDIVTLSLTGKDIERRDIGLRFDSSTMSWQRVARDDGCQIIMALENGLSSISEIAEETGSSYGTVAQALKRLRDDGVVGSERNGRNVVYKLVQPTTFDS